MLYLPLITYRDQHRINKTKTQRDYSIVELFSSSIHLGLHFTVFAFIDTMKALSAYYH